MLLGNDPIKRLTSITSVINEMIQKDDYSNLRSVIRAAKKAINKLERTSFNGYLQYDNAHRILFSEIKTGSVSTELVSQYLGILESLVIYAKLTRVMELRLFAKVTLFRHGETTYSDIGLDLTPGGQDYVIDQKIKIHEFIDEKNEALMLASSPAVRAKGTMTLLFPEAEFRVTELLRHVDMKDRNAAEDWFKKNIQLPDTTPTERIALADSLYFQGEFPEDIFGSKSEMVMRFHYGFRVLLRFLKKHGKRKKIPHVIAVSHFEFINEFVAKLFDLGVGQTFRPAEFVEMTIFSREGTIELNNLPLIIKFRNKTLKCFYDADKGVFKK